MRLKTSSYNFLSLTLQKELFTKTLVLNMMPGYPIWGIQYKNNKT